MARPQPPHVARATCRGILVVAAFGLAGCPTVQPKFHQDLLPTAAPHLALDGSGAGLLVMGSGRITDPTIYSRRLPGDRDFDLKRSPISDPDASRAVLRPTCVVNPEGWAIVAWNSRDEHTTIAGEFFRSDDIAARFVAGDGTGHFTVLHSGGLSPVPNPALSPDPSKARWVAVRLVADAIGNVLALWVMDGTLYGAPYSRVSDAWTLPAIRLLDGVGVFDATATPTGEVAVACMRGTLQIDLLQGTIGDVDWTQTEVRLKESDTGFLSDVRLASNAAGDGIVAWIDHATGASDTVVCARRFASSQPLGGVEVATPPLGDGATFSVALDGGGRAWVAWSATSGRLGAASSIATGFWPPVDVPLDVSRGTGPRLAATPGGTLLCFFAVAGLPYASLYVPGHGWTGPRSLTQTASGHSYDASGTADCAVAADGSGTLTAAWTRQGEVSTFLWRPPLAAFTGPPAGPLVSPDVTLDASSSRARTSSSAITSYEWDFGDGTHGTGGPMIAHTFAAGGPFTVRLRVTDDWGLSSETTQQIAGGAPPPGTFTLTVQFAGTGQGIVGDTTDTITGASPTTIVAHVAAGTTVSLYPFLEDASHNHFTSWLGYDTLLTSAPGAGPGCTVLMDRDRTLTVTFDRNP